MSIEYKCASADVALQDLDLTRKCAELYSAHYGVWGKTDPKKGQKIRLSVERFCEWLRKDGQPREKTSIFYATDADKIVGYAIAFSGEMEGQGAVSWITQLVVHTDYRHQGIAKNILYSIWGLSDYASWGIVSANPFAIRALEKRTRRTAIPVRIKDSANELKKIGNQNTSFINNDTVLSVNSSESKINTKFNVDHEETQKNLAIVKEKVEWFLGDIEEGWEWFAFTFRDQEQRPLDHDEIRHMLSTADSVVQDAYAKMQLQSKEQKWNRFTVRDIDYLASCVPFDEIQAVYDLGCGTGRHLLEIAERKRNQVFWGVGIDYVQKHIDEAKTACQNAGLHSLVFIAGDCRNYSAERKADVVLSLYDVIGTYATKADNQKIVQAAYDLLKPGGYALFSVMNYELTAANARYKFSFDQNPNPLLELKPSSTMEKSGNVFDPEYYLLDESTHLVYRKEQFSNGQELPAELIVRDMRFSQKEIKDLCGSVGFHVIEARFVSASNWKEALPALHPSAKEILILCQK